MNNDKTVTPEETAEYVHGIARELRGLAARANLGFLAYLLAMAEDEAAESSRRLKVVGGTDVQATKDTAPPG